MQSLKFLNGPEMLRFQLCWVCYGCELRECKICAVCPRFFFCILKKLHSLQPWEGKDWAFCENARAVKENNATISF